MDPEDKKSKHYAFISEGINDALISIILTQLCLKIAAILKQLFDLTIPIWIFYVLVVSLLIIFTLVLYRKKNKYTTKPIIISVILFLLVVALYYIDIPIAAPIETTAEPAATETSSYNSTTIIGSNNFSIGDNSSVTMIQTSQLTPISTPAATFTPKKLPTYINSIGMDFVLIPAGTFVMGDDNYSSERDGNVESPKHKVNIDKAFYLGKYEVTQKQWVDVMGSNTPFEYLGDNYPVYNASWNETQDFIKKLNKKEGTNKYRLPSEAEWEYACRADTITEYYFGDDASKLDEYEWYGMSSGDEIHPVGQKNPNPWGLYDMLGNVYERTPDVWHDRYYSKDVPLNGSAWGNYIENENNDFPDSDHELEVIRGGSIEDDAINCRSASRHNDETVLFFIGRYPQKKHSNVGFRLVREV
jgi:formylglycine-generating enzyme required for sulfatase activity